MRESWIVLILSVMLLTSPMAIGDLDPSIVIYFSFDKIEGDKVPDLSGNGNDGTIHGAKVVDGKYGKALEFDGKNAYVEVPANPTLDISDGITLMAWIFKPEILLENLGETIISKKQGGAYCLEVSGWENAVPEKLDSEMRISGTYHRIADSDPLPLNKWVHAAVTYDGKKMRLYRDGKQVAEGNWPGKIDINTANLYVGAESDGAKPDARHGRFKGIIDEVIVADRPFSEDEIGEYMTGFTPVTSKGKLTLMWGKIKTGWSR